MPVHDWTRLFDGAFHHFHHSWISELSRALNDGLLPNCYYALAEQVAGGPHPDVLTLEAANPGWNPGAADDHGAAVAVVDHPPHVRFTVESEKTIYAEKADRIAIHHVSGDRTVAFIEIVSAGNKHSVHALATFMDKMATALQQGCHLLVIDLHPPGTSNPQGIHAEFWKTYYEETQGVTTSEPYTLVAYRADVAPTAYFEPVGLGRPLPDMPLFLTPDYYVNVPLEKTYQQSWDQFPQRWKTDLESSTKKSLEG